MSSQTHPKFCENPPQPPVWKALIHRTDILIMWNTYYWYYAAEERLPWSQCERHLIFSPPSSLSMGPSVVENESSLICMTDKHILYPSQRRSYAMDLGTAERETERESDRESEPLSQSAKRWNDVWSCPNGGVRWGVYAFQWVWISACACILLGLSRSAMSSCFYSCHCCGLVWMFLNSLALLYLLSKTASTFFFRACIYCFVLPDPQLFVSHLECFISTTMPFHFGKDLVLYIYRATDSFKGALQRMSFGRILLNVWWYIFACKAD